MFSNNGKLNTLNINYDVFDNYKVSNYKIIDKSQKYYKIWCYLLILKIVFFTKNHKCRW